MRHGMPALEEMSVGLTVFSQTEARPSLLVSVDIA